MKIMELAIFPNYLTTNDNFLISLVVNKLLSTHQDENCYNYANLRISYLKKVIINPIS